MNLHAIELYLLQANGFVSTTELCERFSITSPRLLRAAGGHPGLLDEFAVSSTRSNEAGFIHHRHLPDADWYKIEERLRSHAISELRKVKWWRQGRHNVLTGKRPDLREVHGGQMLLLAV